METDRPRVVSPRNHTFRRSRPPFTQRPRPVRLTHPKARATAPAIPPTPERTTALNPVDSGKAPRREGERCCRDASPPEEAEEELKGPGGYVNDILSQSQSQPHPISHATHSRAQIGAAPEQVGAHGCGRPRNSGDSNEGRLHVARGAGTSERRGLRIEAGPRLSSRPRNLNRYTPYYVL